jgi:predicted house-cleaning noncanonical NTP pyrophosphatase (MazG superfamily)
MPSELFEALPEDEMEVVISCQKKDKKLNRESTWEFIMQPRNSNSMSDIYRFAVTDDVYSISEAGMEHFIKNLQSKLNETIQEFIEEEIFYETTETEHGYVIGQSFNNTGVNFNGNDD